MTGHTTLPSYLLYFPSVPDVCPVPARPPLLGGGYFLLTDASLADVACLEQKNFQWKIGHQIP